MRKEDEAEAKHDLDQGEGKSKTQYVVLPYMKGVMERIQWAFNKHNIRLYSKAGYTVRNAVVSPKDPLEKIQAVCSDI